MNNEWTPSGEIPQYGYVDGSGKERVVHPNRPRNALMGSDNPMIVRLGEWCEAAPAGLGSNLAAFGGLLMGMNLGSLHPSLTAQLLDEIINAKPGDGDELRSLLAAFLREVIGE